MRLIDRQSVPQAALHDLATWRPCALALARFLPISTAKPSLVYAKEPARTAAPTKLKAATHTNAAEHARRTTHHTAWLIGGVCFGISKCGELSGERLLVPETACPTRAENVTPHPHHAGTLRTVVTIVRASVHENGPAAGSRTHMYRRGPPARTNRLAWPQQRSMQTHPVYM